MLCIQELGHFGYILLSVSLKLSFFFRVYIKILSILKKTRTFSFYPF